MVQAADLEPFASLLALEWDLTECEHDDLLSFGATLAMCECLAETVRVHMEVRAEVLALVGSEMREMYEAMKEAAKEWNTGLEGAA